MRAEERSGRFGIVPARAGPDGRTDGVGMRGFRWYLWVPAGTRRFRLRVCAGEGKKAANLLLADPRGRTFPVFMRGRSVLVQRTQPVPGIWDIRSPESGFVNIVPEEGATLFSHPHPCAPLALRTRAGRPVEVYLEVPEGTRRFQAHIAGEIRNLSLTADDGEPVSRIPLNRSAFHASAGNRTEFAVIPANRNRHYLRLRMEPAGQDVSISTRERLGVFWEIPRVPAPLFRAVISTRDEEGVFLPSRVNILGGWRSTPAVRKRQSSFLRERMFFMPSTDTNSCRSAGTRSPAEGTSGLSSR